MPNKALVANITALTRSLCLDSFFEFVQEFWSVIIPEKPVWNWHIQEICDAFQADAERVFKGQEKLYDTIINIPPGSTKSTILSIMAPAWIHARCPSMRVLCISHTQPLTFELGRKCRIIESSDKYRALFPEMQPSPDQWTKSLFMNTAGGGRLAGTVGGMSPTGFHAHFIIVDDPVDPQKAKSLSGLELEAANTFMSEVLPTRKVDKAVTVMWMVMQRLHQNDPTGYLLSKGKKNVHHICLPATRSPRVRPLSLRKKYTKDGYLDPIRMSPEILAEAALDLGPYGYAGQYDQYPVPRTGGMFRTELIEIVDAVPVFTDPRWRAICRFWDKAGTDAGGAYTAGVLMGRLKCLSGRPEEDEWYILDVVRHQWDSGKREQNILATAKLDTRLVKIGIEQEPGSGGKESAQNTVKRLAGFLTRAVPAVGSKQDRADAWSSLVNVGAFRMLRGPWNKEFLDELKLFPFGKYKDQADAGAGAFTILATPKRKVGAS